MKEIKKVYGPYLVKSPKSHILGRKIVLTYFTDGTRKTLLYSRYLIEQKLGRSLKTEEQVDHIDGDKTNDSIENLQILDIKEHSRLDTRHVKKIEITCVRCGSKKLRAARDVDHNAKMGKAGPFCKPCAGKYGKEIQMGLAEKLPVQPRVEKEKRIYFRLKDNK